MRASLSALLAAFLLFTFNGCGGSSSHSPATPLSAVAVHANPSSLNLMHDGTPASVDVTVTCQNTGSPSISVSGLPSGASANITQPTCSQAGSISFTVDDAANARATTYAVTVQGTTATASSSTSLDINIVAQAKLTQTTVSGTTAFMSTSFQLADWSYNWLHDRPAAIAPLTNLSDKHIRIQLIAGAMPQKDATTWDFTEADAMIQPILAAGDHSPQLQIGTAPTFLADSNGHYIEANLAQFAAYCANLVRYYNTGGFTVNGVTYKSPSTTPITWWGIFNEPNWNNVTPAQYVTMYNAVAQAMLAVDPTIKLVGLELGDVTGQAQNYLPPLVTGLTQPMPAIATHYYSSCNQKDTDAQLFSQVQMFHDQVAYFRSTLDANPNTSGTPIWVTENNVNADWAKSDGTSACNTGTRWVEDDRGTSAYFAAWRPYAYAQFVRAGAAGVWHWSYAGGGQYGELTDSSTTYLSYWVDYHLSHFFGQEAMTLLDSTVTEAARIETFAARASDGSRILMIVNRDIANPSDNNGAGVPKTVSVDLADAGPFTTVTLLAIDRFTDAATGPSAQTLTPVNGVVTLSFPGYGVQFLKLQ